jgi:hypothetical protein
VSEEVEEGSTRPHDPAQVEFAWTRGDQASSVLLSECSALFSTQYGVWSDHAPFRPGERIRMSAERIGALLAIPGSGIATARVRGQLIA